MARPSKLTDAQWGKIKDEDLRKLANALLNSKDDERMAVNTIRLMLLMGDGERALQVPKIDRHRFEYAFDGARIDLLLFHSDGGVSIVEVKANSSLRDIAGGIGQLCLYAAKLPNALRRKKHLPKYVRRILAAPIKPESSADVMAACEIAGVQFVHLTEHSGVVGQFRRLVDGA